MNFTSGNLWTKCLRPTEYGAQVPPYMNAALSPTSMFGVLNRTPLSLDSDVFSHTRIKPEQGESVFECRVRVMKCINQLVKKCSDGTILLVSHPFICQIAFNALLQKDHTLLTEFWHEKGSFAVLVFKKGTYGIQWGFENGYNALADTSYTQDEIYRRLLGKKGAFPS